jgi:hypothetical protein
LIKRKIRERERERERERKKEKKKKEVIRKMKVLGLATK